MIKFPKIIRLKILHGEFLNLFSEIQDCPINGGELINGGDINIKYFFLHIPKAGGTTLNHILDRMFKKSEQYKYSTLYPKKSMEIIHNMPANKYKNIKLFKGHFVYGFHEWFNVDNPKYFTIMRNPIDRVMSHYFYSARKKNHYLYEKRISADITLDEYVKELCPEARNGMTKQIAGVYVNDNFGYGKNVNYCEDQEELYELALNNIKKSFVMVGITEEFDNPTYIQTTSVALHSIKKLWVLKQMDAKGRFK